MRWLHLNLILPCSRFFSRALPGPLLANTASRHSFVHAPSIYAASGQGLPASLLQSSNQLITELGSKAANAAHWLLGLLGMPCRHRTDAELADTSAEEEEDLSKRDGDAPPKDFEDGDDKRVRRHWALLVAGSQGWSNYRHQADVSHAYQASHCIYLYISL